MQFFLGDGGVEEVTRDIFILALKTPFGTVLVKFLISPWWKFRESIFKVPVKSFIFWSFFTAFFVYNTKESPGTVHANNF